MNMLHLFILAVGTATLYWQFCKMTSDIMEWCHRKIFNWSPRYRRLNWRVERFCLICDFWTATKLYNIQLWILEKFTNHLDKFYMKELFDRKVEIESLNINLKDKPKGWDYV